MLHKILFSSVPYGFASCIVPDMATLAKPGGNQTHFIELQCRTITKQSVLKIIFFGTTPKFTGNMVYTSF